MSRENHVWIVAIRTPSPESFRTSPFDEPLTETYNKETSALVR